MTRQQRAEMLAHIWTKHLWPEQGDVKVLTLALTDDDENGMGINVFGFGDLPDLMDRLVYALLGEDRVVPAWLAFTATCYYADFEADEVAEGIPSLEDAPTENTHHGLLVLSVDKDGMHSMIWEIDLDPVIDLPNAQVVHESDEQEEVHGKYAQGLRLLYDALVTIGGE